MWCEMPCALEVEQLGKRFRIGTREPYLSLRERIAGMPGSLFGRARTPPDTEVRALRDVSFSIGQGEVVGILGRNGAGKSTLLKILSRITDPSEGCARIRGRVGSLLEVGTGFHPELTGRENIFLNGAILGMRRSEVLARFDAIAEFAGVERFLDTPVKHYSSGMSMRLAFSVAAHLEPEILLVDEVLAVGDAAFQRLCLGRMHDLARSGRTVLLVSHNLAAVQHLCPRSLRLEEGRLAADGATRDVIGAYLNDVHRTSSVPLAERRDRRGDGRLMLGAVSWSAPGTPGIPPACGSPAVLSISYRGTIPLRDVQVSVGLFNLRGEGSLLLGNDLTGSSFQDLPPQGALECRIERLPLLPGDYTANLYVTVRGVVADWIVDAVRLTVAEGDFFGTGRLPPPGYGSIAVEHAWHAHTIPAEAGTR